MYIYKLHQRQPGTIHYTRPNHIHKAQQQQQQLKPQLERSSRSGWRSIRYSGATVADDNGELSQCCDESSPALPQSPVTSQCVTIKHDISQSDWKIAAQIVKSGSIMHNDLQRLVQFSLMSQTLRRWWGQALLYCLAPVGASQGMNLRQMAIWILYLRYTPYIRLKFSKLILYFFNYLIFI